MTQKKVKRKLLQYMPWIYFFRKWVIIGVGVIYYMGSILKLAFKHRIIS